MVFLVPVPAVRFIMSISPCTAVMNVATSQGIYCLFPELRKNKRIAFACDSFNDLELYSKYHACGYVGVSSDEIPFDQDRSLSDSTSEFIPFTGGDSSADGGLVDEKIVFLKLSDTFKVEGGSESAV